MSWRIRRAQAVDERGILEFINREAQESNVLRREVIDWQNFVVCKIGNKIVGCVGYKTWDPMLPEVISIIVEEGFRGRTGISRALIWKLLSLLEERNFELVFCLTDKERFFARFGFVKTDIRFFPDKIIKDCSVCRKLLGSPYHSECSEVAMLRKL